MRTTLVMTDKLARTVMRATGLKTRWERALGKFERFVTGGADQAVALRRNDRDQRRRGITIRETIKWWIATSCPLNGLTLLHNDRDVDPFERYLGLDGVLAGAGRAVPRARRP